MCKAGLLLENFIQSPISFLEDPSFDQACIHAFGLENELKVQAHKTLLIQNFQGSCLPNDMLKMGLSLIILVMNEDQNLWCSVKLLLRPTVCLCASKHALVLGTATCWILIPLKPESYLMCSMIMWANSC